MPISRKGIARSAIASLALIATWSAPAAAQDTSARATYSDVRLNSGYANDPFTVYLQSGGSIPASNISSDCRGYIANAPDVRITYSAGSLPLIIGVESDWDTTLVVNAPDGRWYCDDDRGSGVNPLVRFNETMSGRYEIWVGTYGGSDVHDATLYVTELENTLVDDLAVSQPSYSNYPDASLSPTYTTLNLTAGFNNDPRRVSVRSGGGVEASVVSSDCRGYVAVAPDVTVNYSAGSLPLIISVNSSADTTLLVNDPNGNWYCDDDSGNGVNPSLRFSKPASGQYDVWVGTYGSSSTYDATVTVSELYSE